MSSIAHEHRTIRPGAFHLSAQGLVYLACTLSVLLVLSLLGLVAWRDRVQTFSEAEGLAVNMSALLAEHANRLFETSDLILKQTIELVGPGGPRGAAAIREDLVRLARAAPYLSSIAVIDADGNL